MEDLLHDLTIISLFCCLAYLVGHAAATHELKKAQQNQRRVSRYQQMRRRRQGF